MGRRCCVDGCKSNQGKSKAKDAALKARNDKKFKGRQNIPLFGLPSKKRLNEERMENDGSNPFPVSLKLTIVPILTSCESPGYSIVSLGLC